MKNVFFTLMVFVLLSFDASAQENSWRGCYLGAAANSLKGDYQWSTNTIQGDVYNDNAGSADGDDTAIGIQFGCDFYENQDWVFGAKLAAADNTVRAAHLYRGGSGSDNIIAYQTKDVISLIARAGFKLSDNGLMYGNLGYTHSSNLYQDTATIPFEFAFRTRENQGGLLVGLGYEHKLSERFSVFAEYNYTDLGDNKIILDDLIGGINDYRATVDQNLSQYSLGINLNF